MPERSNRRASWDLLRRLHANSDMPWCCIGDFNDLLNQDEKKVRNEHPNWCIRGFLEAVHECALLDLPARGYPYTWKNSKGTDNAIEEKLDRELVSSSWMQIFPNARLSNVTAPISGHSPLVLQTKVTERQLFQAKFRFENRWFKEQGLEDMVRLSWHRYPGSDLIMRLALCANELETWGKNLNKEHRMKIKHYKECIEKLQPKNDPISVAELGEVKNNMAQLLLSEEIYWRQRAKTFWLKDGDSNTVFFMRLPRQEKRRIKL